MKQSKQTLVVAIDPALKLEAIIKPALQFATSLNAHLVALSVTPRYEGNMNRLSINDANKELSAPFTDCLKEAATLAASFGVSLETVHRVGIPCDEISAFAEEREARYLIISSPKRSHFERIILGLTTAEIISQSPCDILLVPVGAEIEFSKILVGVDGSQYSKEAGQKALELSLSYGSEIHALSVVDIQVDRSLLFGVLSEMRSKGFQALDILAGQGEKLGVPVITTIENGSPYKVILSYAKEHKIPLIVLGSFGRTAFERTLVGSVVERVAALATCPTLVVKP